MTTLPSYHELPKVNGLPASWGLLGGEGPDYFGCLNLQTPEKLVAAARLVARGAVFPLNWSANLPDPPMFGRGQHTHEVIDRATGHDDVLHNWNTQSSSQWDGFRHIKNLPNGFYDGLPDEDHGVDHWARRGIAGRAVLCDVGRWRAAQGRPLQYAESDVIEPDDILATLESQGSSLEQGDVLLMRTGWTEWYESETDEEARLLASDRAKLKAPGLPSGERTAEFLWDLHIAAIGADNPSVEVWPPGTGREPRGRRGGQERPPRADARGVRPLLAAADARHPAGGAVRPVAAWRLTVPRMAATRASSSPLR